MARLVTAALSTFIALASSAAQSQVLSEFRLSPGDILEISIAGAPDLGRRIPIGLDGSASFPLIGEIQVSGLSLSEIRTRIRDLIPAKGYKNRKFTGSEALDVIDRDEISLELAEYRPLYIMGEISKPGEVKYRPGMNVKQAIAVAGGHRVSPDSEKSAVRRTYETELSAYAAEKVRIWRLMTMLGRTDAPFDPKEVEDLEPGAVARMVELQIAQIKALQDDYKHQREQLMLAMNLADQRVAALATQLKNEKASVKLDSEDLDRTQDLSKRGLVSASRLTEVQRTVLLSTTRSLQTDVAAEGAKRERQEVESRLQRLESALHIDLLKDLEAANTKAEALGLQVRRAREQLLASARTGLEKPMIIVQRDGVGLTDPHDGTPLAPGDVIEIYTQPSPCSALARTAC